MATRIFRAVPTAEFQKLAGFKHVRNVLLAGEKKELHVIWPDGRQEGSWVVMDRVASTFLAQKKERDNPTIPSRFLFRAESTEGKRAMINRRGVVSKNARNFLKMTSEQFHELRNKLDMLGFIDGYQVWRAESVERYKVNQNKGRR